MVYPDRRIPLTFESKDIPARIGRRENPFEIVMDGERFEDSIRMFKNCIRFRTDEEDYNFKTRFREFLIDRFSGDFNVFYTPGFEKTAVSLNCCVDVRQRRAAERL